ncbi:hypothetical protein LPJ38_26505 [Bradyrhizobium daqingense]|uniref:DUF6894 domain-containing protein n=1 Tax=Bradyrhizobium daqingense TaxID=993502 RepID=A0A562LMT0_9BRAD|nr:hypothetical protein [Bradyrhizobium daqingense]TWI08907.1 hypothetical protein IQ17_01732 [Bradyrhizobium daqingense]UFS87183.1 hypothetical protein LPJ38_26505 [Bradyrhizobium daqingense]
MPRYYFHVLNGKMLIDDVGLEVTDIEIVKVEAVKYAGTVLSSEQPTDMWKGIAWHMKVTDAPSPDEGQTYLTLTLTATDGAA